MGNQGGNARNRGGNAENMTEIKQKTKRKFIKFNSLFLLKLKKRSKIRTVIKC